MILDLLIYELKSYLIFKGHNGFRQFLSCEQIDFKAMRIVYTDIDLAWDDSTNKIQLSVC